MKQIWISRAGGPDVLEVREAADPVPGPGEVLIDVRAAGVNFADLIARTGKYGAAPPIPCVVGYEVAGVVREVAPGAETVAAPGDRVMALTRFGGYSSVVSVPADQIYRVPDDMSFSQAATCPVNYFTAYLALVRFCNAQPGERVLIHDAGGGVGIAAIQLARHIGAEIYGTASGWKHERLAALGVHEAIDYRTTDWPTELLRRTGGQKMHVVLDSIGGRNLARDLKVMGQLARLAAYGFSEPVRGGDRPFLPTIRSLMAMPRVGMVALLTNNWSIGGLNLARLWPEIGRLRSVGSEVLRLWDEGVVQPEIQAELPFSDASEAHRLLGERRNIGKVILVP
jgi:NADPH:quinone reductase-like Zn-dependent oxidoreductase